MKPEEIKRWLRAKEYLMYHSAEDDTEIYESLAGCRMLMDEAKQYIQDEQSGMPFDEEQVKELDNRGKEIYRKITAEIASLPGGGSNEPA